ncbi:MAG: ethanolamine ammonia-lyase small subunit [Candidatus Paceibacteria bacterium]|jgi:ethanolamine ammonia-lyase small subunit
MSATHQLIAKLRRRLGVDEPLAAPLPALPLTPPPKRLYARQQELAPFQREAAAHTTALVGIGHVGTRYATNVVLQFQAELAVAHNAVSSELADGWREEHGLMPLDTLATNHEQYLLRPDLGRRLSPESHALLEGEALKDIDIQPILADGLSAVACMQSGLEVLAKIRAECERRGLSIGSAMCARHARVWLEDEIGQAVRAKVAIIILGERPGLGTGDGLSAYVVHEPRLGKTDGDRNMISNIHRRGISPAAAATRLVELANAMLQQGTSGVALDLSHLGTQSTDQLLRQPQVREALVEVKR